MSKSITKNPRLIAVVPHEFKLSVDTAAAECSMPTSKYIVNALMTYMEAPVLSNQQVQQHIINTYMHLTNAENELKLFNPNYNTTELEAAKDELSLLKNNFK